MFSSCSNFVKTNVYHRRILSHSLQQGSSAADKSAELFIIYDIFTYFEQDMEMSERSCSVVKATRSNLNLP
jgi:hypothetical protein